MTKKPRTYAETAIVNCLMHIDPELDGVKKPRKGDIVKATMEASRACVTLTCWAQTQAKLGYNPTQAEYAKEWGISLATADREMARFRTAFPTEKDPARFADNVRQVMRERLAEKQAPATVQALPMPDLAFA